MGARFERTLARCLAMLVLVLAVTPAAAQCVGLPPPVNGVSTLQTSLNGVPAIIRAPTVVTQPPIVLWHGLGRRPARRIS